MHTKCIPEHVFQELRLEQLGHNVFVASQPKKLWVRHAVVGSFQHLPGNITPRVPAAWGLHLTKMHRDISIYAQAAIRNLTQLTKRALKPPKNNNPKTTKPSKLTKALGKATWAPETKEKQHQCDSSPTAVRLKAAPRCRAEKYNCSLPSRCTRMVHLPIRQQHITNCRRRLQARQSYAKSSHTQAPQLMQHPGSMLLCSQRASLESSIPFQHVYKSTTSHIHIPALHSTLVFSVAWQ